MARPNRWNEIVDAAASLFREKGFVATSVEDVARAVGMCKGSLYHYIKSKEDLLFAVVREPAGRILTELRELRELRELDIPPTEKIRRISRSHVRVLEDNFIYCSVHLEEVGGRHRSDECSAMDREYVQTITGIIEEGQERGEFGRSIDPRTTTLALIGSLNWLTHWFRPGGEPNGADIAGRYCDLFLAGLLSRSPNAPTAP